MDFEANIEHDAGARMVDLFVDALPKSTAAQTHRETENDKARKHNKVS